MHGEKDKRKEQLHHKACMQEELDMLDETLGDDEGGNGCNPFQKHCLDAENLSFSELEKKEKRGVAKKDILKMTFQPNDDFIMNEEEEEEEEEATKSNEKRRNHQKM